MVTGPNDPVSQINHDFAEKEAQNKALAMGLDYIDVGAFPINPDVLLPFDESMVRESGVLPFSKNAKHLHVATPNPDNGISQEFIRELKQQYEVQVFICSEDSFNLACQIFTSSFLNRKEIEVRQEFQEVENLSSEQAAETFEALIERVQNSPVEKALSEIQISAIQSRASDIHFQPNETDVHLRFRIDGMLQDVGIISREVAKKIIMRIKYESGMMSNVADIPQDGHLSFVANDRKVDLRVSCLPTEYLESVVMRVLDSRKGILKFPELGFDPRVVDLMENAIHQKNGMVLVTGPTGSGKTTTLYSMLAELNEGERKLVTLEDPIEYHLDNVTQSQVNEKREFNFGTGLRALLRHDPDVMLIGEIREFSVGKLAVEASLTGHLVLSSLHTNSAIGAITRLRNLGIESYNIASSLNAVFAQRLVRRVCSHCGESIWHEVQPGSRLEAGLKKVLKLYPHLSDKVRKTENGVEMQVTVPGKGCEHCNSSTGYNGQRAICEAFALNEDLRSKIADGLTEQELNKSLDSVDDYLTFLEDGIRNVLEGHTTLKEIYRVVN